MRQRILAGAAIGGLIALVVLYRRVDMEALHARAQEFDGVTAFGLLTVLPLLMFPVTPLHVAAGVRFGSTHGLMLVVLSIVLQHLLAALIVGFAPDLFQRKLRWLTDRIPREGHLAATLFASLVPGVPYFATLYVLPLIRVPLWQFILISAPIHSVRSVAGVLFGDFSDELTFARIAYLVVYTLVLSSVCAWAFRLLRRRTTPTASPAPAARCP